MLNKKFHAAFPQPDFLEQGTTGVQGDPGMSLRDYFAAKAMQQLMPLVAKDPRILMRLDFDVANMSYQMADAMMEARNAAQ